MEAQTASRRKFLRAALVGSAAVVAVGAGADAVLARSGGGKTFLSIPFIGVAGASPILATFDADIEATELNGCVNSYNGTGQNYFVFTCKNLPAGNYSLDATQQLNKNTITPGPVGPFQPKGTKNSTLPWDYSDNGNNVHTDTLTANTAKDCPAPLTAPGTGSHLLPVAFSLGATSDVQIYVHINWGPTTNPPSGQTTTFTGIVTDTDTNTVVGSDSITLTAS